MQGTLQDSNDFWFPFPWWAFPWLSAVRSVDCSTYMSGVQDDDTLYRRVRANHLEQVTTQTSSRSRKLEKNVCHTSEIFHAHRYHNLKNGCINGPLMDLASVCLSFSLANLSALHDRSSTTAPVCSIHCNPPCCCCCTFPAPFPSRPWTHLTQS